MKSVKELAEERPFTAEGRTARPAAASTPERRPPAAQTLGGRPISEEEYQRYLAWLEDADWNIRVHYRTVYETWKDERRD